ncbi:MAG: M4 family metallopeptidase, partial [Paludibacteraceae bacterium]|nr:M4 family metallopeptidase [Paludibacteraceae bacterium]
MKTTKFLLLVVMQILFVLPSFSQELFIRDVIAKPSKMVSPNAKSGDTTNNYQQERQIIDNYLKQINPNFSAGDMRVIVGLTKKEHYRFEVLYKEILVDKHKITLHLSTDTTMLITGTTLFDNDIVTTPVLTLAQVIEKLKSNNDLITEETILSNKIVIYKALGGEPYLCYKIEILFSPIEHYYYYVSAINGDVIWRSTLVRSATPEIGMANLHIWGTQTIFTSHKSIGNKFILFDQIANIETRNINGSTSVSSADDFIDFDNNWTLTEFPETDTYSMNAALVCHWAARKTYDFFFTTFNRKGYNNHNNKINIYMNYGGESDGDNAWWSPSKNGILIGNGTIGQNGLRHLGVADIVAHEYGHAVTDYMDENLESAGESGAINEGLADIWAACVENYLGASSYETWRIGDHLGFVLRNMASPNDVIQVNNRIIKQPDTYEGLYWHNPSGSWDNGGVHCNSGVLNYWFYLLTIGGSGINDNLEPYEVDGVGFSISQQVVYETITTQLEENSTFAEFRASTLDAVTELYGTSSNTYKQVMNAWHAVGVGQPYMDATITGDFGVCDGSVYSIDVHPAISVTWSVDKFNDMLSPRNKLTFVSGQGTNTIVVNRGTSMMSNPDGSLNKYKGPVQLTATLTYGNTTITKHKSLFSNNPLPEIQYTTTQSSNFSLKTYKFYVNNVATNHLRWTIEANGNTYTAVAQDFIEINLPSIRPYDVIVSVHDHGNCSSTNYKTLTLRGMMIQSPILSHENPISTNSVFYLKKAKDEPEENVVYSIEIWNEYGLVHSKKYDDAPEFMISTDGLMPGIYFMRIYRNDEFLDTQKLIIK